MNIGVKKVSDLSVEQWETLVLSVLQKDHGLDLQHMLRFMPQNKLGNTPNEIIKSHATELGEALTNLIKREEVIISGSTSDGHVTFMLHTPAN